MSWSTVYTLHLSQHQQAGTRRASASYCAMTPSPEASQLNLDACATAAAPMARRRVALVRRANRAEAMAGMSPGCRGARGCRWVGGRAGWEGRRGGRVTGRAGRAIVIPDSNSYENRCGPLGESRCISGDTAPTEAGFWEAGQEGVPAQVRFGLTLLHKPKHLSGLNVRGGALGSLVWRSTEVGYTARDAECRCLRLVQARLYRATDVR